MNIATILRIAFVSFLSGVCCAQTVGERIQREPNFPIYSIIFGITLDAESKVQGFRVAGVVDPRTKSKDNPGVKVPQGYVDAAKAEIEKRHMEPKMKDGQPVEFFTYFFYTPVRPQALITDLDKPLPPDPEPKPALSSAAPKDQPKGIAKDKAAAYEEAIAPYIEKARMTYPEAKKLFLAGLPPKHAFFLTTRLRDAGGKWEQVFIAVKKIEGGQVTGRIASDLTRVKEFKTGDTYKFPETELLDWLITLPDGTEQGNFVGKFLDTYKP